MRAGSKMVVNITCIMGNGRQDQTLLNRGSELMY